MNLLRVLFGILFGIVLTAAPVHAKSAYDFSFTYLQTQKPLPLSKYKGQVLLIVNTASRCGFTTQYKGLEHLYRTYKDNGFVIIGVPCNDFGGQEPGSSEVISQFCERNYGVSFPLTEKESVIGKTAHPFYKWAATVLGFSAVPKWNFHKILIDKHGQPIKGFLSTTAPDSKELINAIETQLKKP